MTEEGFDPYKYLVEKTLQLPSYISLLKMENAIPLQF